MEPAAWRRDDSDEPLFVKNSFTAPQWSPPLGDGMTISSAAAVSSQEVPPQWSPPLGDGMTPRRYDVVLWPWDAAMEPAAWRRDDTLRTLHRVARAGFAAMEPAAWRRDDRRDIREFSYFVVIAPQWSPPLGDGMTRSRYASS